MYHVKPSSERMQEGFFELLQLPQDKKHLPKKIKKEDVVIQLRDLITFLKGSYL